MAIIFKELVKQDGRDFFPGVPVAFDDVGAEDYFEAAKWADKTNQTPLATYPVGTVTVDPLTVHAETGKHVQPELAAAAMAEIAAANAAEQEG